MPRVRRARHVVPALVALATAMALAAPAPAEAQSRGREFRPEAADPIDPRLEALLTEFERAQAETETMTATFTQVKEDDLFAEPTVQSGRLRYAAPDLFRWDYEDPEHVTVVATPDVVKQWIPAQNRLRVTDISKKRRRAFNYLGVGSDVSNLRRHFEIVFVEDDETHPGSDKIELTGQHRRIQKRLELLEMWIDRETSLPIAVRATTADGGRTSWAFEDVTVNAPLDAAVFDIDVPEDAQVEAGTKTAPSMVDEILDEMEAEDGRSSGRDPSMPAAEGAPARR